MRRAGGRSVVAICAALESPAPGLAAPAVTASPTSHSPTLKLSVNGTGFGTTEAADVYFDTVDNALTTTDGAGTSAPATVTVPASAVPGTHWVTVIGRHSGLAAQASVKVTTNWPMGGFGGSQRI